MEIYKKYRPKSLKRMVGNEQTILTLKNMISRDTVPHTILFHGPSGCGKTTLARILKKELNCHDMDFKELNCSDFRGIDTIRDIARVMNLAPAGGPCRIYLLDEVHQLSSAGQNAALKMFEDTPSHVYFILCTTDPHKLIKTIQTRCTEMSVSLLGLEDMEKLIKRIAKKADVELSEDTIEEIATASQGSARKALVILDKVANLDEDSRLAAIQQKVAEDNEAIDLCRALIKRDTWSRVSKILKNLKAEPESTRYAVLGYARSVILGGKNHAQAFIILEAFSDNFYDSKNAGLARACYESIVI